MSDEATARQFSFRLPEPLVERLERCTKALRTAGLDVTRADVVRMLLRHALEATHCKLDLLIGGAASKKKTRPQK
jgi:hypothetical protein